MVEAEMRGLIERADGWKVERARERMEAVRAATKTTVPEPAAEAEPEEDLKDTKGLCDHQCPL